MIALLCVGWLGCAEEQVVAEGRGPDVLLVLIGHLRAPDAEPFLDALPEGRRFERAYAPSPLAPVSLASVLTGRRPASVGICGVGSRDGRPGPGGLPGCYGAPEDAPTLPEVLGLYGYRSLLVTGGLPGGDRFARGFDEHVEVPATRWEEAAAALDGWWAGGGPRLAVIALDSLDALEREDLLAPMSAGLDELLAPLPHGREDPLADRAGPLRERYRAAAAQAGEGVAALLDREAWALVAGLNGANLGERSGMNNHAPGFLERGVVLERTVHVPLWVRGPVEGEGVVDLVDLFPTIAAWAGAVPPAGLEGEALGADGPAIAACGSMLSLVRGSHRLTLHAPAPDASARDPRVLEALERPPGPGAGLSVYSLHDVLADPLQERDLLTLEPERAAALHAELAAWRAGLSTPSPRELWELRMRPGSGYW